MALQQKKDVRSNVNSSSHFFLGKVKIVHLYLGRKFQPRSYKSCTKDIFFQDPVNQVQNLNI